MLVWYVENDTNHHGALSNEDWYFLFISTYHETDSLPACLIAVEHSLGNQATTNYYMLCIYTIPLTG